MTDTALPPKPQEFDTPNMVRRWLNQSFAEQHPDEGVIGAVAGQAATVGKGVIDAGLRLGRGVQWLYDTVTPKSWHLDPLPTDLRKLLPEEQRIKLESRLQQAPLRTTGEAFGTIMSMIPTGGVGTLATMPGRAIGALSAPGLKLGAKLVANLPAASKWTQIAQNVVPAAIGLGTGFGIYNYATAEGGMQERAAALGHGLMTGAAMGVLGQVASAAERAILSAGSKGVTRAAADDLLSSVNANTSGILEKALRMDAALVASTIEGTGFAGLDRNWWSDVIAGAQGDEEARNRALQIWMGSVGGVLMARLGNPTAFNVFRREMPQENNLDLRLLAYDIRNAKEPQAPPPQGPEPSIAPQGPAPTVRPKTTTEPAMEVTGRLPGLSVATDPLFKSGWDLAPEVDYSNGTYKLTMEFPGAGKVRLWENEGATGPAEEGLGIEVPADVFRAVRGKVDIPAGSENIRMVGKVADEFLRDLSVVSMLRRIRGELYFGGNGEVWAGGPWRGVDGTAHTIGLDGKHYTMSVPFSGGYTEAPYPAMPTVDNRAMDNPEIVRWVELTQALAQHTAPTPGRDLIEASIALAVSGDPNSRSVQEIQRFLSTPWQPGTMNADLVGQLLLPDTIDQFGITMGQIAAGHLTADAAMQQVGTSLIGPSQGSLLTGPEYVAPVSTEQQLQPSGVSRIDELRGAARKFSGDVEVPVSAKAANLVADFVPSKSTLSKTLRGMTKKGVVRLTESEAKKLVDYYARRSADLATTLGAPQVQSIGSFIDGIVSAYGAKSPPSAPRVSTDLSVTDSPISPPSAKEIAGSRDWSSATPAERREGAKQYLQQKPDAPASVLRDTFLLPDSTARKIASDRSGEAGFINTGDAIKAIGKGALAAGNVASAGYERLAKPQLAVLADRGGEAGRQLSDAMREAVTRKRALLGASSGRAKDALKALKKIPDRLVGRKEKVTTREGEQYETYRYRSLIEGKVKPEGASETTFAEKGNEALLTLQHTAVGAGMQRMIGGKWVKGEKAGRATVPYQYSDEYYKAIEKASWRKSFYEELARLNPNVTADSLEGAYVKRKGSPVDVNNPESVAAYEMQRQLHNVPAEHNGVQVLEPDPAVALHRIIERQSGRAATMQVFGQDLPGWLRKEQGITKPGITETLRQFNEGVIKSDSIEKDYLMKTAADLAARIQGREPNQLGEAGRLAMDLLAVPRSFGALVAGMYDASAFFAEPLVYAGFRNTVKAAIKFLTSRGNAAQFGSLSHELGNLDLGASASIFQKIAEMVSVPSNIVERIKTEFFDRVAQVLTDQIRTAPRKGDVDFLREYMRFSHEDAVALSAGAADQVLYDQLRRELVVRMASRGRNEERSAAGASPLFKLATDYVGYATMRLDELGNEVKAASKILSSSKTTMASKAKAVERAMKRAVGFIPAGLLSTLLAYVIADLFKGSTGGVDRFKRDLLNYPAKTLLKSTIGQVASGPLGTVASAITEGDTAQLARLVTGVNVIAAGINAVVRGNGDPFDTIARFAVETRLVPRQLRDVVMAATAAYTGTTENVRLVRMFSDWKRLEGIDEPPGVADKQAAFYEAMRKVVKMVGESKDGQVGDAVQAEIDKALALQPGEVAAARLRSMRFLPNLSDAERVKFLQYVGESNHDAIVHHDDVLTALATQVGRRTGTYPMDWSEDLENATTVASSGAENAWGRAIERVVREEAERLAHGTPARADLTELAGRIATYPESAAKESSFSDDQRKLFESGRLNHPRLSNVISLILREKAANRASKIRDWDRESKSRK